MAGWVERWQANLARLRRPVDEAPGVTASVLDPLIALPAHVEAADTADRRLTEMRTQLDGFAAACVAAAGGWAIPGASRTPSQTASRPA